MNRLLYIFLFFANFSLAQTNERFLNDFFCEGELKNENFINSYNRFDYSFLWSQTENYKIFGIIGEDHQRIRIKLISIVKNSTNPNEYLVVGKSNVKGVICDFIGTIILIEIKRYKDLHFGVDAEYKDKGIKSEGIIVAMYDFKESPNQEHSGIFKGNLYSKWYINSDNNIMYDDIHSSSDGYMNNAFIGTWKNNLTEKGKICNWADHRVPLANSDFDIGAGEFSPSKKYYNNGWAIYQKAWLDGDKTAKSDELKEWWK
jgi:hypothetical protein